MRRVLSWCRKQQPTTKIRFIKSDALKIWTSKYSESWMMMLLQLLTIGCWSRGDHVIRDCSSMWLLVRWGPTKVVTSLNIFARVVVERIVDSHGWYLNILLVNLLLEICSTPVVSEYRWCCINETVIEIKTYASTFSFLPATGKTWQTHILLLKWRNRQLKVMLTGGS